MKKFFNSVFQAIPGILSSKPSIFIFLFLFFYLVILGMIGIVIPALEPSTDMQLVLGNYTNVTSALGAAISAGASTAAHSSIKDLHKKHDALSQSVGDLHKKIDELNKKK